MTAFAAPGNFGDAHKLGQIQAYEISEDGGLIDRTDYKQFYDLESYLFDTVNPSFHRKHFLSTFDFFCIVIWKANRAKTKIARKLKAQCDDNLDLAVYRLTSDIYEASTSERKLDVVMNKWNFRLPMASAILTVLYPEDFTIYDVRVCDSLRDFHKLSNITQFNRIWEGYCRYVEAVRTATPANLSLRDKDRYLWGKSFFDQLKDDVYSGFSSEESNRPTQDLG